MYIDNSGNLNILTTDSNLSKTKSIVRSRQKENQVVIYRPAEYSFKFLTTTQEKIMNQDKEFGIIASEVDEINNKLIVYTLKGDRKSTNIIKAQEQIKKEDYIVFKEMDVPPQNTATYTVKNGNNANKVGSVFSLCVGIKFSHFGITKYGFLTAGHCGLIGEKVRLGDGTITLGTIRNRAYSGSADIALIERSTSPDTFKATREFRDGTMYTAGTLNYVSGGFAVGTNVTKYGRVSMSIGKIKSNTFSGTFSGVKFTNLVSGTFMSHPGDSGGAIKVVTSVGGFSYTYVAGITKGVATVSGVQYGIYTDMNRAKSAISFQGYYE